MGAPRRHKAFIVVDDESWLAFKAACVVNGWTIEHALGAIVLSVVASPVPMGQLELVATQKPRKAAARTSQRPAAKAKPKPPAKPKKRSAGERFGTNTRSSRPADRGSS